MLQLIVDATDLPHLERRPRCEMLVLDALTVHELRVFLCIWIVMGRHALDRIRDYWNTWEPCFRVDIIADAMKRDRFVSILVSFFLCASLS